MELEQGPEVEAELVAVEDGTGFLASMAGRAGRAALGQEPELGPGLGLWLWQVQGLVLRSEPGLEGTQVQGQSTALVVSQASMPCWAGQASTAQAGRSVPATRGTQATGWATCC